MYAFHAMRNKHIWYFPLLILHFIKWLGFNLANSFRLMDQSVMHNNRFYRPHLCFCCLERLFLSIHTISMSHLNPDKKKKRSTQIKATTATYNMTHTTNKPLILTFKTQKIQPADIKENSSSCCVM